MACCSLVFMAEKPWQTKGDGDGNDAGSIS